MFPYHSIVETTRNQSGSVQSKQLLEMFCYKKKEKVVAKGKREECLFVCFWSKKGKQEWSTKRPNIVTYTYLSQNL